MSDAFGSTTCNPLNIQRPAMKNMATSPSPFASPYSSSKLSAPLYQNCETQYTRMPNNMPSMVYNTSANTCVSNNIPLYQSPKC